MNVMPAQKRIEEFFSSIALISFNKPRLFIFACVLLLGLFSLLLSTLKIDVTNEGWFHKNDPALTVFQTFKKNFGRNENIIVNITSERLFTRELLLELIAFHQRLEQDLENVRFISSLHNTVDIYGEDDELIVAPLLEQLPSSQEGFISLAEKTTNLPFYGHFVVSKDTQSTNIYITPVTYYQPENADSNHYELLSYIEIHNIIQQVELIAQDFPLLASAIHISGLPVVSDQVSLLMMDDLLLLTLLSLLIIGCLLYLFFKQLSYTIIPLIIVSAALISTLGIMGLTGATIQTPAIILPPFILAVGVCDAIHLLTMYLKHLRESGDEKTALKNALKHCCMPLLFTTLTTAAGVLSFAQSDVFPIANLGIYSAIGVFFAFFYSILLLPALLATSAYKTKIQKKKSTTAISLLLFEKTLPSLAKFSIQHHKQITLLSFLLLVTFTCIAMQLQFSHNPLQWLPKNSSARIGIEHIEKKFEGTIPIDIVIDSGIEGGIKEPEFLRAVDKLVDELYQLKTAQLYSTHIISLSNLIKQTNQALFNNEASEFKIPDSRELIAQELLMIEISAGNELAKLIDSAQQKTHITVMVPWVDAIHYSEFILLIEKIARNNFSNNERVHTTGVAALFSSTLRHIIQATASSYLLAFMVIFLMMSILLNSLKQGIISMIPNLIPITFTMALMHITHIPLDMFSMLITSIAIGLSVDDTAHFMHGFKRHYEKTGNIEQAIISTISNSGFAILTTTIILSAGFSLFVFSSMNNLSHFGLLTALCISVAAIADLVIAPALVMYFYQKEDIKVLREQQIRMEHNNF